MPEYLFGGGASGRENRGRTAAVRTGNARRRYDERGIYYEWDDGPHGWD